MTEPLVVRPRRLRYTAWAVAAGLFVIFAFVAAALRAAPAGQASFAVADQIAMTLMGALGAAGVLVFTRFRVEADLEHVRVRNSLGEKAFPWGVVREVLFVEGDSWPHLELHDDETVPLLAVQANDGATAREAVAELRRLHAASQAR